MKRESTHPVLSSRRAFLRRSALLGACAVLPGCLRRRPGKITYQNPVYAGLMPDPGVLFHDGFYYAFGTTTDMRLEDGRIFTVLRSPNLVEWTRLGGALVPPRPESSVQYWAPEVVFHEGRFYLYYSAGTLDDMHFDLRVATSERPEGPYEDLGTPMRDGDGMRFTIDAHPFRDDDGQWYLFYAKDYVNTDDGYYAGTGLAVDRLLDMSRLAGKPRMVARARYPWTLYETDRPMPMYGEKRYDWHTIEAPVVRKHEGKYYCFYSGANYGTVRYGVDYVVADEVTGPYSNQGDHARVLAAIPGKVRGPGHHSIVKGPDGETDFMVYHAWNAEMGERQMCIDPLRWTSAGPYCAGPSLLPRVLKTR